MEKVGPDVFRCRECTMVYNCPASCCWAPTMLLPKVGVVIHIFAEHPCGNPVLSTWSGVAEAIRSQPHGMAAALYASDGSTWNMDQLRSHAWSPTGKVVYTATGQLGDRIPLVLASAVLGIARAMVELEQISAHLEQKTYPDVIRD